MVYDEICRDLVATKGIVYLMFVGRKAKAYDVARQLTAAKTVGRNAVVYQYVNQLQRKGYIKNLGKKTGRGSPKMRTAGLEAVFDTIGVSRRLVDGLVFSTEDYSLRPSQKKDLESLFKKVGALMDFFPEYLNLRLGAGSRTVRKLSWIETLHHFLHFCIEVIDACNTKVKTPHVAGENHAKMSRRFRSVRRKVLMANIVQGAVETKKISESSLVALSEMTIAGYREIYTKGTFLYSLYVMALGLTNPEAASFVENLVERG